jgi:hypothetical protein
MGENGQARRTVSGTFVLERDFAISTSHVMEIDDNRRCFHGISSPLDRKSSVKPRVIQVGGASRRQEVYEK